MADSMYNSAIFDTLTWESREARLERGGVVWRSSCQKCHGVNGQGAGDLAQQLEIEVPPLSVDTTDPAAIRRAIFVGHEGAMPNWGLHGLKYRDIDAVTAYIIQQLVAPAGN
jgi:mono/diheme cytochrome c family protein